MKIIARVIVLSGDMIYDKAFTRYDTLAWDTSWNNDKISISVILYCYFDQRLIVSDIINNTLLHHYHYLLRWKWNNKCAVHSITFAVVL